MFKWIAHGCARALILLVLCSGTAACQRREAHATGAVSGEVGLTLAGLNYTDMPIGAMYVNGSWGGAINAHNGCCGFAGGVSLPYPWQPGTKVLVKWSDNELYRKDPAALYSEEVEVPPYEMVYSGFLWVAFYPEKKVKVYVSDFLPGHPDFPSGLQIPRKECDESPDCRAWYVSKSPPREGHY
ncbi:DUF3304 domain-containing protein [Stenotrophomonas nitritireducens]|uniref:DUF3304 domain-containing protein n=1 Tax=Stenotrophomonas nitritireducens TaxID=83617 RepID=UPI001560F1B2|nr:DUF3304 domain-containing protein [Stenotrophomonas nitritireducens]